jgi:nucleotide-binding universal stress UspA family protein
MSVSGLVVVGADGSEAGERAVGFAFAQAGFRSVGLVALHTWTTWNAPLPAPSNPAEPYVNPSALAEEEQRLLHEALAGQQERYPGVKAEHRVVHGSARETLIEASRFAGLVVVGARGRGGFTGLLLGSVSQALLHHAHSPVAVVRGTLTTLLGTVLAGLPAPMSAIQLLRINIIMDGPPAMVLGIDPPHGKVMSRPPRRSDERILGIRRLAAITRVGAVMAAGTVAVFTGGRALTGSATAATMAFTAFVLFQLCNALAARSEDGPVLGRHQLSNRVLWICLAAVLAFQVVAVQAPFAQGVFDTVPLGPGQWAVCLATASTVLLTEHVWRAAAGALRRRRPGQA